jgi:beta-glucosidase
MISCIWAAIGMAAAGPMQTPARSAPSQSGRPEVVQAQPERHSAITPARRDGGAYERFERMNERVSKGDVDLVFIGDSITQAWEGPGKDAWTRLVGDWKAVNLGISGDRTQHVLWRLDHGNVDGISPKVAVVMIGTNNSNGQDNSVEEIADGVRSVVAGLREKLPDAKILLLDIFPRGERPNEQRGKLCQVNQIIAKLHDGKHVHFMSIGDRFLNDDGSISPEVMPDYLHLSPKGYEIWADALRPRLVELMKPI